MRYFSIGDITLLSIEHDAYACELGNATSEQEAHVRAIAPRIGLVLALPNLSDPKLSVTDLGAVIRDALQTIAFRGIAISTVLSDPYDATLPALFRSASDPTDRSGNALDRERLDAFFETLFVEVANSVWPTRERGRVNWTLYVLRCNEDCWYVGVTRDFQERFKVHIESKDGADWPKLHVPLAASRYSRILGRSLFTPDPKFVHLLELLSSESSGPLTSENLVTLALMETFGWRHVRGGRYSSIRDEIVEAKIREEISTGKISAQYLKLFDDPSPNAGVAPDDCVAYVDKLRRKR